MHLKLGKYFPYSLFEAIHHEFVLRLSVINTYKMQDVSGANNDV